MSQVNLLPQDILQRQVLRRRTMMIGILGGVAVLAVLLFYFVQTARLSGVEGDISAQEDTNAAITTQIAGLTEFATLQADAQAKENLLATAYANEISFSGLLMDMLRVIPSDAYLDTLAIAETSTDAAAAPVTEPSSVDLPIFVGTIQSGGKGLTVETLSTYLTRLESVKGWVNPWLNALTKEPDSGAYAFTAGVDLTDEVITPRGKEAALAGG